jgi:signal transduction histidine kinase
MKKIALQLLLTFASFLAFGQENRAKIEGHKLACEKILAEFAGKPESIAQLIQEGEAGLTLCTDTDYEYKFAFNQALGTGYYYRQDFKNASTCFEHAYQEARQGGMTEKSLKPLGNLISIYHYLGQQTKADSAAQQLKQVVDGVDAPKSKSDAYYNLGLYNQQQKFYYGIALTHFLKSAELHKSVLDTTTIPKLKLDYGTKLMMVAEIYLYLKQPDKAIQYLREVEPYLGMSKIVDIATYGKFVRSYALLNNEKEALHYYDLLHQTAAETSGKWSELVSSNLTMATLVQNRKDFRQALVYLNKADKQSRLDNQEILTSSVNLSYGDYYKSLKEYGKAARYYRLSEHGSALFNKEQYLDLLKSLTAVEIALGDSKAAETYYTKFIALSDSLTSQKIALNIAETEAVFQNNFKQQQIEVQNLQLEQNRTQRLWLISGLSLLALISVLLIIIYQNKKRTAQVLDGKNKTLARLNTDLEEANQTKARLFSIISHDLRSPISQVYQFLKLQQLNPQLLNETQRAQLSEKIQTATGSLLETMEDLLLWSKTQMSQFKVAMQPTEVAVVVDQCLKLMQLNLEAKNLTVENRVPSNALIGSDPYYLQTILRNLLQNAIKAADAGSVIQVDFVQKEDRTATLSVGNSGGAFSQQEYLASISGEENAQSLHGLGLRLIAELSEKIRVKVQFNNPSSDFTRADLIFDENS